MVFGENPQGGFAVFAAKQRPVNIGDEDAAGVRAPARTKRVRQFAALEATAGTEPSGYTETRFFVRESCS